MHFKYVDSFASISTMEWLGMAGIGAVESPKFRALVDKIHTVMELRAGAWLPRFRLLVSGHDIGCSAGIG